MLKEFEISFENDSDPRIKVEGGQPLSLALDVNNSPILFGCRTGICGTCLVEVIEVNGGELSPMSDIEEESLEIFAPQNSKARLACQLEACAHLRLKKIQAE